MASSYCEECEDAMDSLDVRLRWEPLRAPPEERTEEEIDQALAENLEEQIVLVAEMRDRVESLLTRLKAQRGGNEGT